MTNKQIIDSLIANQQYTEAINAITANILEAETPMQDNPPSPDLEGDIDSASDDAKALADLEGKKSSASDDARALADLYYQRGLLYWRLDQRGAAMTDYEHALSLDSASQAGPALSLARSIMDFFNPDLLNP